MLFFDSIVSIVIIIIIIIFSVVAFVSFLPVLCHFAHVVPETSKILSICVVLAMVVGIQIEFIVFQKKKKKLQKFYRIFFIDSLTPNPHTHILTIDR